MADDRRRTVWGDPINPDMGEGRYQDTLRRFRGRIAAGLEKDSYDSNFHGSKGNAHTWGLCSDERDAYPDVNDHVFPGDAKKLGRVTHRGAPTHAGCPFDRGLTKPDPMNPSPQGCFWRCDFFRPEHDKAYKSKRVPAPTREEAVARYDVLIAEREAKFGRKVTADDGEQDWEPRGSLGKGWEGK